MEEFLKLLLGEYLKELPGISRKEFLLSLPEEILEIIPSKLLKEFLIQFLNKFLEKFPNIQEFSRFFEGILGEVSEVISGKTPADTSENTLR